MILQVGDAAHAAYVDGTGLALSLEDAAVLAYHVQQQGLTAAALRAFEAERIPRVKAVFGLTAKQAAAMKAGVPQRQLLDERAELLYGQAHFKPLQPPVAAAARQ
jgi:2-polyprenyl-6-methoxyphenol hydroxylase-like FAD-dependent oxidoreductase